MPRTRGCPEANVGSSVRTESSDASCRTRWLNVASSEAGVTVPRTCMLKARLLDVPDQLLFLVLPELVMLQSDNPVLSSAFESVRYRL